MKRVIFLLQPDAVLQVDAGADVIRDDGDAVAELRALGGLRNVDLAVFLGKACDDGVGVLGNQAVSAAGRVAVEAVRGEGLGAGIDNDFVGNGVADHGGDDPGGAIVNRAVVPG